MSCVLLLEFCIAIAMASGVADAQVNIAALPTLKPPQWYEYAEQCCNHELSIKDPDEHSYDKQLLRDCAVKLSAHPYYPPCEPDLCFAMKKGYASIFSGAIYKPTLEALLEVEFQHNLETLKKILADCVYGDLSKYPMHLCEIKRLNMCISVHVQEEVLRGCNDWKDYFRCLSMRLQVTWNVKKYLYL